MADLRALLASATPGPWRAVPPDPGKGTTASVASIGDVEVRSIAKDARPGPDADDAALIVAAVNALPGLLDVAEAARTMSDEYDRYLEAHAQRGHPGTDCLGCAAAQYGTESMVNEYVHPALRAALDRLEAPPSSERSVPVADPDPLAALLWEVNQLPVVHGDYTDVVGRTGRGPFVSLPTLREILAGVTLTPVHMITPEVETVGTWMAATRQQLTDAGQTRSLIDNQGQLMIDLEVEDQLINCGPICWTTGHHHDPEACDGCRRLADMMHAAGAALTPPTPDDTAGEERTRG